MKIKNVKGSSKVSPKAPSGYNSWLDYWEKNKKLTFVEGKFYTCPGCGKDFLRENWDGCHVQKEDSTDSKWYIVPLCDSCNHTTNTLDVDANLLLDVPSNLTIKYSD